MAAALPILLLLAAFAAAGTALPQPAQPASLHGRPLSNITVMGSVFCDVCSNNTFGKHSFFLKGARVQIQCNFKMSSGAVEQLSLEAERTTDQFGIFKLSVPPVDGFECREGHELRSACRAILVQSASPSCDVPALRGSTQQIALRSPRADACFLNLNALSFRPAKKDHAICGGGDEEEPDAGGAAALFFWPFLPPIWPAWLPPYHYSPFPSSFPFPIPQWLIPFLKPPYFPFPLFQPPASPAATAETAVPVH